MDRATGGICRSIGAKGLFIVWGNDRRYWGWAKREGSRLVCCLHLYAIPPRFIFPVARIDAHGE